MGAVTSPVTEPVAAPVGKRVAHDCEAADRAVKRARTALRLAEFDAADAKEAKERSFNKVIFFLFFCISFISTYTRFPSPIR